MPKILTIASRISVYMYFKDHNPPHIHIYNGTYLNHDAHMKVNLETFEIIELEGFSGKSAKKILKFLRNYQVYLLMKWSEFYEEK